MESQNENFAVQGIEGEEGCGDALAIFKPPIIFKGCRVVAGDFQAAIVLAAFAELFKAEHGALAANVDDEIAGDGVEPGVKARLTFELRAADKDPHPRFLKEVFGQFAIAGEVEQVAQQAMLVLNDEAVQDSGILPTQALRNSCILTAGLLDCQRISGHDTRGDARRGGKVASWEQISNFSGYCQAGPSWRLGVARAENVLYQYDAPDRRGQGASEAVDGESS